VCGCGHHRVARQLSAGTRQCYHSSPGSSAAMTRCAPTPASSTISAAAARSGGHCLCRDTADAIKGPEGAQGEDKWGRSTEEHHRITRLHIKQGARAADNLVSHSATQQMRSRGDRAQPTTFPTPEGGASRRRLRRLECGRGVNVGLGLTYFSASLWPRCWKAYPPYSQRLRRRLDAAFAWSGGASGLRTRRTPDRPRRPLGHHDRAPTTA
jgi:hypothetical protein